MKLDGIDCIGLDRVLKRGTGEILAANGGAVLVWDSVSRAHLLACEDPASGAALLDRCGASDCCLLMVTDLSVADVAFERLGFSERFEVFQVAYYGDPPVTDGRVHVREADESDLPLLVQRYDLITPAELARVVARRTLLLGYVQERLVGFIGEHLEGSMGLLQVFPEFRRRGYATALERHCIAWTMARGFVPFGQVEKHNLKSLNLQKKLGLTQSENPICWMWKRDDSIQPL